MKTFSRKVVNKLKNLKEAGNLELLKIFIIPNIPARIAKPPPDVTMETDFKCACSGTRLKGGKKKYNVIVKKEFGRCG